MTDKLGLYFYIIIGSCFVLGIMDFFLSRFLLSTGYFREANMFAFPYFLVIPLFLLFPKHDKLVIDALLFLAIFLGVVVSINLINLGTYVQVIS